MTTTEDHGMHRKRRSIINPFFSVSSVRKLEPVTREHTEKVLNRIEQASGSIEVSVPFKAYASDTVVQYAFSDCFHFLNNTSAGSRTSKPLTCSSASTIPLGIGPSSGGW